MSEEENGPAAGFREALGVSYIFGPADLLPAPFASGWLPVHNFAIYERSVIFAEDSGRSCCGAKCLGGKKRTQCEESDSIHFHISGSSNIIIGAATAY